MSETEKVGHGVPPLRTRYKSGTSGNPNGRPKGRHNFAKVFERIMSEYVTVETPSGPEQVIRLEAVLKKHLENGISGKDASIKDILSRAERYMTYESQEDAIARSMGFE